MLNNIESELGGLIVYQAQIDYIGCFRSNCTVSAFTSLEQLMPSTNQLIFLVKLSVVLKK